MRILLVAEAYNSVSGVSEAVDNLAAEFARREHEVVVVSTRDPNPARSGQERVPRPDVRCTYLRIRSRKPLTWRHPERLLREPIAARSGELARFVQDCKPEIVNSHVWTWDKYPTIVQACRMARAPLVQSFWDTGPRSQGRLGAKNLHALRWACGFTAGSAATKRYFEPNLPGVRDARVIIGGIDGEAAQGAPPYRRDRPYIFCASRLDLRDKAIDVLLDAFRQITDGYPNVDLLIAGGGPDRAQIEQLVTSIGLGARVELVGVKSRDELRSLYKGALLFAMPSRREEGVPLVFLEALAAGTPVVGTRVGGTAELVRDGENGLLVGEDRSDEFAAALRVLLSNPEARREMGMRGKAQVLVEYSWPTFAAHYLEVYTACLDAARKRSRRAGA